MTQSFTVYDSATGRILRTGEAPISMVAIQAGDGESTLVGNLDASLYFIGADGPEERPAAPSLPDSVVVGEPVAMLNVDDGAQVTVTDSYGTEHTFAYDAADPLILTDPGGYLIHIVQTFPALSMRNLVEVINA